MVVALKHGRGSGPKTLLVVAGSIPLGSPPAKNHRIRLIYSSELEGFGLRNDTWWRPSHSLSASKTAGSLLALLWVLLGTLGVSVSLDTNSASMPHMCELGFETPGDEV